MIDLKKNNNKWMIIQILYNSQRSPPLAILTKLVTNKTINMQKEGI